MKIQRLRIDLTPAAGPYGLPELRVQVRADGIDHTSVTALPDDDLDSRFDFLFERAKNLIRESLEKTPTTPTDRRPQPRSV